MFDIRIFARGYGSSVGDTEYDARLDFDSNGRINIIDLRRVTNSFGYSCSQIDVPVTISAPVASVKVMLPEKQIDLDNGSFIIQIESECKPTICAAFDLTVHYDPEIILVTDVELTTILGEDVLLLKQTIDNETGLLHFAATAVGQPPETLVTTLIRIVVIPRSVGTSSLIFSDSEIADAPGNPINVIAVDGFIEVEN